LKEREGKDIKEKKIKSEIPFVINSNLIRGREERGKRTFSTGREGMGENKKKGGGLKYII